MSRRPSVMQVRAAARTLANAMLAEAQRIRDEQGPNGHVAAQELEHDAIRVRGFASRVEAIRQSDRAA